MPTSDTYATFASGCFWCTEAVFKRVRGVSRVVPGYTGGTIDAPHYDDVSGGDTGHAEAIQMTYDPAIIPYEQLVRIFFGTHDPTQLNRQGHDVGSQYRSAIFYHDGAQRTVAERVRDELNEAETFSAPIVTEIQPAGKFFEAEPYHHNYYETNPDAPYCQVVIDPKISQLRKSFQKWLV
ncbi:MAG: peptide-methionine (S)-S-oxide reductase MsrA [Candidatus Kerfeldbacteria bacterium]|nr:peptide-methionine (S)-S-oxide reductase MsrA [Candidatus Kerfeldbacteria bacterium]